MDNIGRRNNDQNQEGGTRRGDGYRNVTRHNNGQERGNNSNNISRAVVPYIETEAGREFAMAHGFIGDHNVGAVTSSLFDP